LLAWIKKWSWLILAIIGGGLYAVFKLRGNKLEKAVFELEKARYESKVKSQVDKVLKYEEKSKNSMRKFVDMYDNAEFTINGDSEGTKRIIEGLRKRLK